MGDLVTLTRPDGSLLQVDPDTAKQLVSLGYKAETEQAKDTRAYQAGQEAYYSTPGQKFKTALEGVESGLTLGVSDKLLDYATEAGITGDEWRHRAETNPGTRLASNIVGGVGGALLTGGASSLTRGIESATLRGAATGAIEGGAYGLGGEISSTALTGDPLTVEGALSGMGWGALWGGGLGAVGGAIEGRIAKGAAAKALEEGKPAFTLPEEQWVPLHASIKDAAKKAEDAFKTATTEVEGMVSRAESTVKQAGEIRNTQFNAPWTEELGGAVANKKDAIKAFKDMREALRKKDWHGLEEASTIFTEKLGGMNQALEDSGTAYSAGKAPVSVMDKFQATTAQQAVEQVKDLGAIGATLKTFAETPAGFASMGPGKFEKMIAAVDNFMGAKSAELSGAQEGLAQSIKGMAEHVGITAEGNPTELLRATWETLREMKSAAGVKAGEKALSGSGSALKELIGVGAAKLTGQGYMGYLMGKSAASGLLNIKGAVLGAIGGAASNFAPKAAKALRLVGPQLEPLKTRLDGSQESKKKTQGEYLKDRMQEIREAAPGVRDTLYRAVGPIDMNHPEFAQEMHRRATEQFMWLYNKMPQDPGNAFSKMQSLWKADPVATEKFSRYYEVFQNPIGVMLRAINTGRITPEAAEAMQNLNPALFTYMRTSILERISNPAVLAKMSYDDQVHVGLMLGITMHSTMTPQFIATQQQMFAERNQKLPMNAQPGAPGGSGGRPNTDSPYSTQAQKSTER